MSAQPFNEWTSQLGRIFVIIRYIGGLCVPYLDFALEGRGGLFFACHIPAISMKAIVSR
jgi:hypothetical protein